MDKLPSIITKLAASIRAQNLEYNAIAFRGMSGALVVPMLCRRLKKGMIVCRKTSEKSHGGNCEGYLVGGGYIIVDDFIGCGDTVKGIVSTISDWYNDAGRPPRSPPFIPRGIFLYDRTDSAIFSDDRMINALDFAIPVFGTKGDYNPKDL